MGGESGDDGRGDGEAEARGELEAGEGASQDATSPSCAARACSARRQGRYVRYTVNLPELTALGANLLAAVLR